MVARLVGELRVDVYDVVADAPGAPGDQHVVEDLRVALVDVAVALTRRQRVHQGPQLPSARQFAECRREREVVEVPRHDDVRLAVHRQQLVHEVPHEPGLLDPLLFRGPGRGLEPAVDGLVAALGGEVVRHHEHRAAPEDELAHERLAAVQPGGVPRGDTAGRHGQPYLPPVALDLHGRGRVTTLAVDEPHPLRVEQEPDADVAAGLATVRALHRIDLPPLVPRSTGRLDGVGEPAQRLVRGHHSVADAFGAVVVLDLLQRDDVRCDEVAHHTLGEPGELLLTVHGGQVLDVVGRHGQLARPLGTRDLAFQAVVLDLAEHVRHERVAAVRVVLHRAGRHPGERVARVGRGEGPLREGDQRLDLEDSRVGPVVAEVDGAATGAGVLGGLGGHVQLVVVGARADEADVDHGHQLSLVRLPEVEGVGVRA